MYKENVTGERTETWSQKGRDASLFADLPNTKSRIHRGGEPTPAKVCSVKDSMPFDRATGLVALVATLRCSAQGSGNTELRPHWSQVV